ncbi:heparinase II/III family protein [Cohnella fermenti]|uniref:heparinase II/III family protein n=1 Tax=Cohnella fermenti TaxID=2565925 RepID=UPI001454C16A|nr:heparinase II/III family protein [Cohnella fermenti]
MNRQSRLGFKLLLCAVLAWAGVLPLPGLPGMPLRQAQATDANGHLTDEELFGAWDGTTSAWTTAGKLDYGYSSGLTPVEAAVKAGDYALAKEELLDYYKTRTGFSAFPLSANGTYTADLTADHILWRSGGSATPETEFSIGETEAEYSVDLTSGVSASFAGGQKEFSYILMGRYKNDTAYAELYSSEQSANRPMLEITAGGTTVSVPAFQDSYIRAGSAYQNVSYGASPTLYVQDSGIAANAPLDENSRRAYLSFRIPTGVTGTITSAVLKVYGQASAGSGGVDVLVVRNGFGYSADTLTWLNSSSDIFSYNGLADGPDWTNPSGAQVEYVWTLSRFQFFGDIVGAYAATGDEKYARESLRLLEDFISQPSAYNVPSTSQAKRSIDVSFRPYLIPRMLEHLYASPWLTPDVFAELLKNVWQTENWLNFDPNAQGGNNWALIEAKGVYASALYFPEFTDAAVWSDTQKQRIDKQISRLVFLDGGYTEASYNYSLVALQVFWDFKRLADLYGDTMTQTFKNNIVKVARYMMDFTLPSGYSPVYGDGGSFQALGTYAQIANDFGDEELQYFASMGAAGTEPQHDSSYYPDTKQVTMRTGWQPDDKYMLFTNSTGTHGHMDQNALIAYAYGKVLLTDTGVNDYNTSNPISKWQFDDVESHNTIRIDGQPQSKYNGLNAVSKDTMTYTGQGSAFDFSEGTTYATTGFEHTRSVLFVKPDYWIVSDWVGGEATATGTHTFEQNWHTMPGANPFIDGTTKAAATQFSDQPNIAIVPASPSSLGGAVVKDGWYGATSAPNEQFVQYSKTAAGPVTFDTVLVPTGVGESRSVTASALAVAPATNAATAMAIDLDSGGRTAAYYLSRERNAVVERSFGTYSFNGKMAYVEKNGAGTIDSVSLIGGSTLSESGTTIIAAKEELEDMAVRWNGATLELSGSKLVADADSSRAIGIAAAGITKVTLNGVELPFAASGGYVYAVRPASVVYDYAKDFGVVSAVYGWQYKSAGGTQPLLWQPAGAGGFAFGTDDFSSTVVQGHWSVTNNDRAYWTVVERPGYMRIKTQPGDLWATSTGQKNLILQVPFFPDYQVETKLEFSPTTNYQAAGLILYADEDNYIKFDRAYDSSRGGAIVRVVREFQTASDTFFRAVDAIPDPLVGSDIMFRLTKRGVTLKAEYSGDGTNWTTFGSTYQIPSDTMKIGMHAMNTAASTVPKNADFDYFHVTQLLPDRWVENTAASTPIHTKDYTIPGTGLDAVMRWVAPASGTVHIHGNVASQNAFAGGDNFQVKVEQNGVNVWPKTGFQTVGRADTRGYAISELVQVQQGDVLSFTTNRVANAQNDVAKWQLELTMYPDAAAAVSGFDDGTSPGWTPLNASRWTVDSASGTYRLIASGYSPQSGDRPGEYSLLGGADADSFRLSLKVGVDDDLAANPDANAVVLFNYQDDANYYYLRLDNDAQQVRLYKVSGGIARVIADSTSADWIQDNALHAVVIDRDGPAGTIAVSLDKQVILRAADRELRGGTIGVGSLDGAASFDDIGLVALD